jgi:hypothetical protein
MGSKWDVLHDVAKTAAANMANGQERVTKR